MEEVSLHCGFIHDKLSGSGSSIRILRTCPRVMFLSRRHIFSAAMLLVFSIVLILFKDIPNIKGDEMHGIKSLASQIGSELCAVDITRLRFRYSSYSYVFRNYLFLHDVSLPLLEMDIFAFIHTPDPTKVRVVERERNEDEPRLLDTTVGRNVLLLPVAPNHAESKLEASVERLFDEGGSGTQTEQGDFAPRHQGKRKSMVMDAGGASHPPKKLREDHGTPSEASVGGKSWSEIKRLLAGAVLNAEVRVAAIPTLPFVTAFVSSTPEHEDGDHTDSVAEPNLRTIGASQRFVISSDSSHHYGPTIAEAEVDYLVRSSTPIMTNITIVTSIVNPALVAIEKPVKPSLFSADSSLGGGADPNTGVFSDLTGSDFLVGGIRTMVDEFAPPKFFAFVHGMKHDQLFTEFNVRAASQISLSAEVRMRNEYNVKERRRLKSVVEKQDDLLKARDGEIKDL
ncbi:hypothetical protein Tco_0465828, partial [Tanacetum coccineum]